MKPKALAVKLSQKMTSLDLVVLSHNGLEVTKHFLDLLYQNTKMDDWHLIMIDNGSTDGTPDYLKKEANLHKNMSLFLVDQNTGVIGGRNLGYEIVAKTLPRDLKKYIMFLDNDQYVQPGWLSDHIDFLNRGYDMVGVEAWQLNGRFIPVRHISHIKEHFSYVGCGGMIIKREVTDKIGMFDERFNPSYFEDPDYNFQAYKEGFKIGWNYKAKIIHMPHQTLGKLGQKEKHQRFVSSLMKMRDKWKGFTPPRLYQDE